jgi:hypothetical protein
MEIIMKNINIFKKSIFLGLLSYFCCFGLIKATEAPIQSPLNSYANTGCVKLKHDGASSWTTKEWKLFSSLIQLSENSLAILFDRDKLFKKSTEWKRNRQVKEKFHDQVSGLSICDCLPISTATLPFITKLLSNIIESNPSKDPITFVSIGSGHLLLEVVLIHMLIQNGFNIKKIALIDNCYLYSMLIRLYGQEGFCTFPNENFNLSLFSIFIDLISFISPDTEVVIFDKMENYTKVYNHDAKSHYVVTAVDVPWAHQEQDGTYSGNGLNGRKFFQVFETAKSFTSGTISKVFPSGKASHGFSQIENDVPDGFNDHTTQDNRGGGTIVTGFCIKKVVE